MSQTCQGEVISDERAELHHRIALMAICLHANERKLVKMIASGDNGTARFPRSGVESSIESLRETLMEMIDEYLEKGRRGEL